MTNSTDNFAASGKLNSRGEAPGTSVSPESNKVHISTTAARQSDIESLPDTRQQNIHQYPEHVQTYMRYNDRGTPSATLSMSDMGSTLPGYQAHTVVFDQHTTSQHFIPTGPGHGVIYSQMYPLPVHPDTAPNMNMPFNSPYSQAYPHYSHYAPHHQQHQHMPLQHSNLGYQPLGYHMSAHLGPPTAGYGQTYYTSPPYAAIHGQSAVQANVTTHFNPYGPSHNIKDTFAKGSAALSKETKSRTLDSGYDVSKTIVDGSTPMKSAQARPSTVGKQEGKSYEAESMDHDPPSLRADINLADSTALPTNSPGLTTWRGPPRKPKQTGHALWVGNLPPGTEINGLKDYFSQHATKDVESVFLISKSNCAFVNYKTETACLAALSRFHDSKFHGARLVCRLRRGSMFPTPQHDSSSISVLPCQAESGPEHTKGEETRIMPVRRIAESKDLNFRVPNRYFIVKSLSMDDLELSRQSGIWATQAHNEDNLNQAYQTADNVYLMFSANKSGEYYGYARMMSRIQEDDGLTMEMPSRSNHHTEPDDLNLIPTPATSTAPNGRIINDLARGIVFWEADSSEDEDGSKFERSVTDVEAVEESGFQSIGKPFRIQWLSTERVPFHRTRGLRNPWNENREIKIARDGTEIEPAVGERLVQLFHTPYPG